MIRWFSTQHKVKIFKEMTMAIGNFNTVTDANKQKALDLALQSIEKQFGKGAIMKLGADEVKFQQSLQAV